MSKLPIDPAAQAYYIRAAQIRAQAQAAHEAESRKLMAQEIAKAIRATQSGDGSTQATPKRKRIKHIPYKQALAILEGLNCPKDRKTLLRWMKGENTPDNFTPEKMLTVEAFLSWATIYAHREQAKIDTNNALRINNPNSRKMQKFR